MEIYKEYKLIYYKLEDTFLRKYMLHVDAAELLSVDIYLALMNYPKYSSESDILFNIASEDKAFFRIYHGFERVEESKLIEYKERYDIINLKYTLLPQRKGQLEELYDIEYDELKYVRLWTLIMGLLYYLSEIENNPKDDNNLYISKINTANEIITKLLKQLEDNPDPKIKENYNRIRNCFEIKLIKEADLSDQIAVEKFFSKTNDEDKNTLNVKKRVLRQS